MHAPTPSVPASPAATSTPVARSSLSHITRIQIDTVESPTFEGKSFGNVGPYEKLVGRAFGEIDPKDAQDSVITDLKFAPRNARGMVHDRRAAERPPTGESLENSRRPSPIGRAVVL
jgi:hypothetical protein